MRKKRRAYPPKHRVLLAQKARKNKPWKASTGPKTDQGKAAAAQNALKSGLHTAEMNELRRILKRQKDALKNINIPSSCGLTAGSRKGAYEISP